MPIIVKTKELVRELSWVSHFSERKTTIPILSQTLFESADGVLRLTATDLEIGGITEIAATGSLKTVTKAAFPTSKLIAYLNKLDAPEIKLSIVKNGCTLKVEHGSDVANIEGLSAEYFPELPKPVYQGRLFGAKKAIPRVLCSVSDEITRFTLNGALLDVREADARFVSTDGHRLTVLVGRSKTKAAFRAMIPQAALLEVKRLDQDVVLFGMNDVHVFFCEVDAPRQIISRKLTGSFPDYETVLPTSTFSVVVDADTLRKAIQRVSVFADKRSGRIEHTFGLALRIANKITEGDSAASAEVPCSWKLAAMPQPPITIDWNWNYAMDFLKLASGEVTIKFTDDRHAVEFLFDGWRYIFMPMRRM